MALNGAISLLYMIISSILSVSGIFYSSSLDEVVNLKRLMTTATSFKKWTILAERVDSLTRADQWRRQPLSVQNPDQHIYDENLISARIAHFKRLEIAAKRQELDPESTIASKMFFLRAGFIRSLGGIGGSLLYKRSMVGTKIFIEDYINLVLKDIHIISESSALDRETKIEFFSELLQTLGRSALILHGGAAFGLCHFGVIQALYRAKLLPQIVCGSHIGALIAAYICVQSETDLSSIFGNADDDSLECVDEVSENQRPLNNIGRKGDSFNSRIKKDTTDLNLNLNAFKNKTSGAAASFRRKLTRLIKEGRIFDVKILEQCARDNIGDVTFKEAYVKSGGRILNITVHAKKRHELPVILNYLTAPNMVIWSAACASCATSFIYEELSLLVKSEDGKITPWRPTATRLESARIIRDLPVQRLTELFNANNFIVSQVPSYLSLRGVPRFLFSRKYHISDDQPPKSDDWLSYSLMPIFRLVTAVASTLGSEFVHRFSQLKDLGLLPSSILSISSLLQAPIVGDVLITPAIFCRDIQHLFTNPTTDFIEYCKQKGQVATWRRLAHIKMRCIVEFTLERILSELRNSP